MTEIGILIVDDDVGSQSALKQILDSEGWLVHIVPLASQAMSELASGNWNLAIVNVALLDLHGPLFTTLKELVQSEWTVEEIPGEQRRKQIRALFLVPLMGTKEVRLILEREELPYSLKPYHLHEFLEKVSELLVESGALAEPIRSVGGLSDGKKRRDPRLQRSARNGAMFASRDDYQMSEEEMADFERQEREEEERKKGLKQHRNGEAL